MNFNLPDFKVNNIYRLTLYVSLAILVGSFFFETVDINVGDLRLISFLLVLISAIAWMADGQLQRSLRKHQYDLRFIEKMMETSEDKQKTNELIECYEKYEDKRLQVDIIHFISALLIIIILLFDVTGSIIVVSVYIILIIVLLLESSQDI